MGDLAKKYNLKSPAVKRLMREAAELSDPTDQYFAQPLEDNLFEWHFTVRGSPDTEFEDGRYHGRITLPAEYPMKPPSIILLTPNGRFEVGKKICLSMSAHHPETWQPSWSIRTVLLALIGFMPTAGAGAIGALDHTPDERKILAKRSKNWKCDSCRCDNKTCLLERDPAKEEEEAKEIKELAAQINFKGENKDKENKSTTPSTNTSSLPQPQLPNQQQQQQQQQQIPSIYGNHTNQYYSSMSNSQQMPPPSTISPNPYTSPSPTNVGQQPALSTTSNQDTPTSSTTDADTTTTTAATSNENSDPTLRQRVRPPTVESSANDAQSLSFSEDLAPSNGNEHHTSRAERVSLFLTWIVSAILVILIIRRLAMEGSSTAG